MTSKKSEVNLLIKIIRTIYETYGDRGTWSHRDKRHNVVTFKYGVEKFRTVISQTPRKIGNEFGRVRTELKRIGLDKGNNKYWNQLIVRMATPIDDYLDMKGYLEALEELIRVSKSSDYGSSGQRAYFKDVKRVGKQNIPHKKKKPYRKRIEFDGTGKGNWTGEIKYWRHYVWAVRFRRDDTRVEGFLQVDKLTYQRELKKWKAEQPKQK